MPLDQRLVSHLGSYVLQLLKQEEEIEALKVENAQLKKQLELKRQLEEVKKDAASTAA